MNVTSHMTVISASDFRVLLVTALSFRRTITEYRSNMIAAMWSIVTEWNQWSRNVIIKHIWTFCARFSLVSMRINNGNMTVRLAKRSARHWLDNSKFTCVLCRTSRTMTNIDDIFSTKEIRIITLRTKHDKTFDGWIRSKHCVMYISIPAFCLDEQFKAVSCISEWLTFVVAFSNILAISKPCYPGF